MSFLTDILNSTPVVQGGITLMAAGWIGYQLREFPGRITGFIRTWSTREIEIREYNPLYGAWLTVLTEHAVRPGGPRTVALHAETDEEHTGTIRAGYKAGTDPFWAYFMGRWCRVHVYREQGSAGVANTALRFMISVEIVGGTRRKLDEMLAEVRRRAGADTPRQRVDMNDRYGSRHTMMLPLRSPSTLCLPAGQFESLERRLRDFLASQSEYERAGIPWRFGVLLYGPPGTGKTSLAHVLASQMGLRLCVIPIADLRSDEDLVSAFQSVGARSIVLLEDIDSAFRGRSAKDAEGITFAGLLNCIDGMLAPHDGRILMMSTNHLDKLDPALVRPGRVDLRLEIGHLTKQAASDYVDRIFPHVAARHDIVAEVMATPAPTPAILINRIMREPWKRPAACVASSPPTPLRLVSDTPLQPSDLRSAELQEHAS